MTSRNRKPAASSRYLDLAGAGIKAAIESKELSEVKK
jgi:hypothetical protein